MKRRTVAVGLILLAVAAGCAAPAKLSATATPDVAKPKKRIANDKWQWFRNMFFRPAKELVYVHRWWGRATGKPIQAKNVDANGNPVKSVVFMNRDITRMTPAHVRFSTDLWFLMMM